MKDKIISTPALEGTILPGVTRKSIIEIARSQGYRYEFQENLDERLIIDFSNKSNLIIKSFQN